MSSYFRQLGKSRDARKIIKELVERIARLESQVNEIETIDFSQIIRSNNDRIVYVGSGDIELNGIVQDPNLRLYQMPVEPDGNKLTLWLRFLKPAPGGGYNDESGFQNHGVLDSGSPTNASGPNTSMPSLRFDGLDDTISIPNNSTINLQTAASSTGFSVSFNINPTSLSLHGGKHRIIACKTDDSVSARQWGWMIWLEANGNLFFHVRIANVFYTASKTFAFPSVNKWYRLFCTFTRSTNTPRIYVDGALSTDAVTTYVGALTLPSTNTNLYIGSNDIAGQSYLSGFLSDFRFWREKAVTSQEIGNIQQSGLTISFTLFPGRAGVGNFLPETATTPPPAPPGSPPTPPTLPPPPPPPTPSTIRSFSSTSFTTTSCAP